MKKINIMEKGSKIAESCITRPMTDNDALRERDQQDVRDGLMQKWEYRVKWYGEDEETAKAMCAGMADPNPYGFS